MGEQDATVFIVGGETGEYSDRTEWPVRAFFNRGEAEALVLRLTAWCDAHQCGENGGFPRPEDAKPEEDPGFYVTYTGCRYSVTEVPIHVRALQAAVDGRKTGAGA